VSASCGCFRFWLDDDEGLDPDSADEQARAAHLLVCPGCREETEGIVAQRASVRSVFRSSGLLRPLSEAQVTKFLDAMRDARRGA
jgi:hypothetical protein